MILGYTRVLYSLFNRFIYLRSPEEHGAAPLVQPHGCGVDSGHCIGTTSRLYDTTLIRFSSLVSTTKKLGRVLKSKIPHCT
jgi:hypothetical protein